jgi:hypothetical protein
LVAVSSLANLFFESVLFVGLTIFEELDPIWRAADGARRIQERQSEEMISTTLGRFLRPRRGRSVILM